MKNWLYISMIFGLTGCASAKDLKRLTLIIPVGFKGEIFVAGDPKNGQDPKGGQIQVPPSGLVFVKSLPDVAKISPDSFSAKDGKGKKLGNSVLKTGTEVSLWPVTYVDNELLYFVVGTFDEKIDRENEQEQSCSGRCGGAQPLHFRE
jgi:hypothetical protein